MTGKKELGIIDSTYLGIEDHGIFTFSIGFSFGGTGQGLGSYSLDRYDTERKKRVGTAYGCEVIRRILKAVGVDCWEKLVGKEMWVIREDDSWGAKIIGFEAPAYRKNGGRFNIKELNDEFGLKGEE